MGRWTGRRALERLAAGFLAVAISWAAAPAWAGDESTPYDHGAWNVGFLAGYGEGFAFAGSGGSENEDVRVIAVSPGVGVGIGGVLGDELWLRGAFEARLEGLLIWNTRPRSGFGGGTSASLRYHFLYGASVWPYLELGAGLMGLDFDLDRQRDGFNFTLQGGGGLAWRVSERVSLVAQYRYHHISNARTRLPNDGINTHQILLGTTFFLF